MKNKNLFWGIVCLALAAFIVLSFTGILNIPFFAGLSTGKFIATVVFLIVIISSLANLTIEPIIISLGVLLKLYEEQLGIHVSVPVLVVVIILLIMAYHFLFPHGLRKNHSRPQPEGPHGPAPHEPRDEFDNVSADPHEKRDRVKSNVYEDEGDFVTCKTYFNGVTKYINSKNFTGAAIDTAFGGVEIYFTNTEVPSGHATLDIDAKFSGVNIYVPYNWKITNHANAVMGAITESPMVLRDGETWPVELELTGSTSFSGVDIKRI